MEDLPGYLVKPRYPIKMPERSHISSEDHTQEAYAEESGGLPGVEMAPEEGQAGLLLHGPSRPFPWGQWAGHAMYLSVFLHPQV